jgi:hypothetical protein
MRYVTMPLWAFVVANILLFAAGFTAGLAF